MKIIFLLLCVSLLISGCSEIGNKSLLVPQAQDDWQKSVTAKYVFFKCDSYSVEIKPILVQWDVQTVGPILPVIPWDRKEDNRKKNIQISLRVTGNVAQFQEDLNKFSITLYHDGNEMKPKSVKRELGLAEEPGKYWNAHGQPSSGVFKGNYSFPLIVENVKSFSVNFSHQIGKCIIPSVTFTLKSGTYGEFTPAPGP